MTTSKELLYEETLKQIRVRLKQEDRSLLNESEIEELNKISPELLNKQFQKELNRHVNRMQRNSVYGAHIKPE